MASKRETMTALPMLAASPWQMSYGERAVLEGVLAQVRPNLAIEIGTAQGGSLLRIAAYSQEVHSFDLVRPPDAVAALDNVTFHTGDSHELLPEFLSSLDAEGRNVDFVLVDGDHSAEGARRDLDNLLASGAVRRTVILAHDTMNDDVRRGLDSVDYARSGKVRIADLDFIAGYLARSEPYRLAIWGGLGLVVVDDSYRNGAPQRDDRFHSLVSVVRPARDLMIEIEQGGEPLDEAPAATVEQRLRAAMSGDADHAEALRRELERSRQIIEDLTGSASWRLTAPLRALKRRWANRPASVSADAARWRR